MKKLVLIISLFFAVSTWAQVPSVGGFQISNISEINYDFFVYGGSDLDPNLEFTNDNFTTQNNISGIFSNACRQIVFNGSMWVAVGSGTNTIAYSTDGENWTGKGSVFSSSSNDVVWTGTRFVAVGYTANEFAYSPDGITWTTVFNSIFNYGFSLAVGGSTGDTIIAGGRGTYTMAYSVDDGSSWTGISTSPFDYACYGLAYYDGMWISGGQNNNTMAYSYDGLNWTALGDTIFSSVCFDIAYGDGKWVAVGQGASDKSIAYSYDGINWFYSTGDVPSITAYEVYYNGVEFFVGGRQNNKLTKSTDGIVWTEINVPTFDFAVLTIQSVSEPNITPPLNP